MKIDQSPSKWYFDTYDIGMYWAVRWTGKFYAHMSKPTLSSLKRAIAQLNDNLNIA
jgi:O-acetylhomoserine/O-acetylserine sulfhydrylase-like pyridoxal-dependent enzyme